MKNIIRTVDAHRDMILAAERAIWATPELGFKEWKTSQYMEEQFARLGYTVARAENIPGFCTVVDTGRPGPEVMVLAELDAVICRSHPESDPVTGAVHACGHHAQCAAMLGVAAGLRDEALLSQLSGRIRLCVVPAEECLEFEYRSTLRDRGIIRFFGGKSEFLSRGYFDGVDMAFMIHHSTGATESGAHVSLGGRSLGFISKTITYKGVTSHASAAAHLGKNALYAANHGMVAANALRETFRESDHVRWHPIMTAGGDTVNNIPETAVIESQLRALTYDALETENKKIDRALIGAAISLGTQIEINDEPGYAPLYHDPLLGEAARDAYNLLAPETNLQRKKCSTSSGIGGGSMDLGDLSSVMPVIHPYISGSVGKGHGSDYYITDPETACVTNAKWQLMILKCLLENGAERAEKVRSSYHPPFAAKEEFLARQERMRRSGDRIEYLADGGIRVIP